MGSKFVHTLSFPEHIWIDFFRSFFSQEVLLVDDDLNPVVNNFRYEFSKPAGSRRFDVLFEHDMTGSNPNILPALVIEDMGMQKLGIALDSLSNWEVSPETTKTRSDLMRSTYVFHCCSRKRGESRLLASIVSNALTVFYDQLKREGLHKIEPWSIGKTVPIKADADEVYVDTPVQVTFETQQTWKTVEDGSGFFERFCLVARDDSLVRYLRMSVDITDPVVTRYVATLMSVQDPNESAYVNTSLNAADPLSTEGYVRSSMDIVDPLLSERYVRTQMRVT